MSLIISMTSMLLLDFLSLILYHTTYDPTYQVFRTFMVLFFFFFCKESGSRNNSKDMTLHMLSIESP